MRPNSPFLRDISGCKWHKWHLLWIIYYDVMTPTPHPLPPPLKNTNFADPPLVFKLAWNNANDPNKELSFNITQPVTLHVPQTEHRANEIKFILAQEVCDHHLWGVSVLMIYSSTKDLWELAVGGDIHGVVSLLQISVPWMPDRRRVGGEKKWGDASFLALLGKW